MSATIAEFNAKAQETISEAVKALSRGDHGEYARLNAEAQLILKLAFLMKPDLKDIGR